MSFPDEQGRPRIKQTDGPNGTFQHGRETDTSTNHDASILQSGRTQSRHQRSDNNMSTKPRERCGCQSAPHQDEPPALQRHTQTGPSAMDTHYPASQLLLHIIITLPTVRIIFSTKFQPSSSPYHISVPETREPAPRNSPTSSPWLKLPRRCHLPVFRTTFGVVTHETAPDFFSTSRIETSDAAPRHFQPSSFGAEKCTN